MTKSSGIEVESGPSATLVESLGASVRRLRAALLELYATIGADPSAPQEVSRRFGVTKSQAWKLSKVMNSVDAVEAARYMPGAKGFATALEALTSRTAAPAERDAALRAAAAFHTVVSTHAGDRATFELTLDSMRAESAEPAALESSRKLSFLGNSATWGVCAGLQLGLRVVVPSEDDPALLSCANVTGLLDLRRLRSTARWPMAHYAMRYVDAAGPAALQTAPLDPAVTAPGAPPLLKDFCSRPLPPIDAEVDGANIRYELTEGPVGKTASLDCVFGMSFRDFAPMHASEPGEHAEHSVLFRTPVELALVDLLLHRDLPFEAPRASLYSRLDTERPLTSDRAARLRLPLAEQVEPLGSGPPLLATPHFARQAELAAWVVERLGHSLDAFVGYRLVVRYPPIPTMLSLEHPLLEV